GWRASGAGDGRRVRPAWPESGRAASQADADENPGPAVCGPAPRYPADHNQGIRLPVNLIRRKIDLAAASLPVPPPAATAFLTVRPAPGVARAGPARSRERLSHSGSVVAGDQQYVKTRENGHAAESDARGHLCPPRRKDPGPRSPD